MWMQVPAFESTHGTNQSHTAFDEEEHAASQGLEHDDVFASGISFVSWHKSLLCSTVMQLTKYRARDLTYCQIWHVAFRSERGAATIFHDKYC